MSQPLPAPISGPAQRGRGKRLGTVMPGEGAQGFLFILPALVLLGALILYPAIWTIRLAFDSGIGLKFTEYVGFANFKELLTEDPSFLNTESFPPTGALVNNFKWVVLYTGLCLGLGLLIAVLATRVRYEALIKSVIFVPMAISATAVAIIWLFVYSPDPNIGLINATITGVSDGIDPISWVGRESTVNYAIIFAYVWASTGFVMVVLSAALKGIPTEILEAARVDGAGEWPIFRRIILPMLSLPIAVVTVWLLVNVIKVFDIIYIMTKGGPSGSSRVIAYTMFTETFENGRAGYGAAVSVFMLILMIPIGIFYVRRFRTERVA